MAVADYPEENEKKNIQRKGCQPLFIWSRLLRSSTQASGSDECLEGSLVHLEEASQRLQVLYIILEVVVQDGVHFGHFLQAVRPHRGYRAFYLTLTFSLQVCCACWPACFQTHTGRSTTWLYQQMTGLGISCLVIMLFIYIIWNKMKQVHHEVTIELS